jgi:hypothetical protein
MDEAALYELIFAPVVGSLGALDECCLTAIVGFWADRPISLRTIGRDQRDTFVTYVTCELAVREDQIPSNIGRYELLITCNDENWAWTILTKAGQMTIETAFGSGHTLDIGAWVGEGDHVQGLAFEELCRSSVEGERYAIFRLHGLTRDELNSRMEFGVDAVLAQRKHNGVYPLTQVPQPHKRLEL